MGHLRYEHPDGAVGYNDKSLGLPLWAGHSSAHARCDILASIGTDKLRYESLPQLKLTPPEQSVVLPHGRIEVWVAWLFTLTLGLIVGSAKLSIPAGTTCGVALFGGQYKAGLPHGAGFALPATV